MLWATQSAKKKSWIYTNSNAFQGREKGIFYFSICAHTGRDT